MDLKTEGIDVRCAVDAAYSAGSAILDVYSTPDFNIELKSDHSPLTRADLSAHDIIVNYLSETKLPILSEEGEDIPYSDRSNWNLFWMVDPLDGTKEFIKKSGEFTVNIALIKNGEPVFGVVYSPVLKKMYFGGLAVDGSYFQSADKPVARLKTRKCSRFSELNSLENVRVVISRSYQNKPTLDFIDQFLNSELIPKGSSLKFLLLLDGVADVYPRFAPCMEWDTAAAHAVLKGAGLDIYRVNDQNEITSNTLTYNKENLYNPNFISF